MTSQILQSYYCDGMEKLSKAAYSDIYIPQLKGKYPELLTYVPGSVLVLPC